MAQRPVAPAAAGAPPIPGPQDPQNPAVHGQPFPQAAVKVFFVFSKYFDL